MKITDRPRGLDKFGGGFLGREVGEGKEWEDSNVRSMERRGGTVIWSIKVEDKE